MIGPLWFQSYYYFSWKSIFSPTNAQLEDWLNATLPWIWIRSKILHYKETNRVHFGFRIILSGKFMVHHHDASCGKWMYPLFLHRDMTARASGGTIAPKNCYKHWLKGTAETKLGPGQGSKGKRWNTGYYPLLNPTISGYSTNTSRWSTPRNMTLWSSAIYQMCFGFSVALSVGT